MALLGSEPVSAANLAGALGIETGGGRSRVTSAIDPYR